MYLCMLGIRHQKEMRRNASTFDYVTRKGVDTRGEGDTRNRLVLIYSLRFTAWLVIFGSYKNNGCPKNCFYFRFCYFVIILLEM